jgi:hypothetical protein
MGTIVAAWRASSSFGKWWPNRTNGLFPRMPPLALLFLYLCRSAHNDTAVPQTAAAAAFSGSSSTHLPAPEQHRDAAPVTGKPAAGALLKPKEPEFMAWMLFLWLQVRLLTQHSPQPMQTLLSSM